MVVTRAPIISRLPSTLAKPRTTSLSDASRMLSDPPTCADGALRFPATSARVMSKPPSIFAPPRKMSRRVATYLPSERISSDSPTCKPAASNGPLTKTPSISTLPATFAEVRSMAVPDPTDPYTAWRAFGAGAQYERPRDLQACAFKMPLMRTPTMSTSPTTFAPIKLTSSKLAWKLDWLWSERMCIAPSTCSALAFRIFST